jgi:glutamine amidotransferase
MCELLGMSAHQPTDVNHLLAPLRPRGGEIGPHADGWGIAFYEGRATRVFKEPTLATDSPCPAFIAEHDYRSTIVIGHIRKANPPEFGRLSANTHPFSRELGGRSWVFAHNGKLPGVKEDPRFHEAVK